MLLIYKDKITLEVQYSAKGIGIQPVVGKLDDIRLLHTIARNEELLAQLYLDWHADGDTDSLLKTYFTLKGWLVKEL